jgi:hypothetical protein
VGRGKQWPAPVGVWAVLTHPEAPHTEWSINQMLAIELAAYLDRVRPRRILEAGSGYSTAILAAYVTHHDAELVTLEHDRTYFRKTMRVFIGLGVDRHVDLRLAPLRPRWFEGRGPYQWYDSTLEGDFDFVFIDGPPKVVGHSGVLRAPAPRETTSRRCAARSSPPAHARAGVVVDLSARRRSRQVHRCARGGHKALLIRYHPE